MQRAGSASILGPYFLPTLWHFNDLKKKPTKGNKAFLSGQLALICFSIVVNMDLQASSTVNSTWINRLTLATI